MLDVLVALLVLLVVFKLVVFVPVDVVVLVFVVLVALVVFDVVCSTRIVSELLLVSLKCLLEAYYCICDVCI